jgi:hypothetical protein
MSPILAALPARGPFPAWREQLMVFGQFVGVWEVDAEYSPE